MTDTGQLTDALGTLATENARAQAAVAALAASHARLSATSVGFGYWRRGEPQEVRGSVPIVGERREPPPGALWLDDFATLDPTRWAFETRYVHPAGTPGGMSAYGMFSPDPRLYNVADSVLTLSALYQSGTEWLMPILSTRGLVERQFGIWRAAMRWDAGHALWPAFWLRDPNATTVNELDIVEAYPEPATPRTYTATKITASGSQSLHLQAPADFSTEWHVYEAEWTASEFIARLDGAEMGRSPFAYALPALYALLNLTVGVFWVPSVPNASTPRNPKLQVDWVGWWSN